MKWSIRSFPFIKIYWLRYIDHYWSGKKWGSKQKLIELVLIFVEKMSSIFFPCLYSCHTMEFCKFFSSCFCFLSLTHKWKYQWPLFCVIKHLFRALSCICCLLCFVLFCFVICFVYFNVNDKSENIFSF